MNRCGAVWVGNCDAVVRAWGRLDAELDSIGGLERLAWEGCHGRGCGGTVNSACNQLKLIVDQLAITFKVKLTLNDAVSYRTVALILYPPA